MSYLITAIVRRARLPKTMRGRPEVKAVALALADRAHDDGRNAWPSVATMAAEAEISARTCDKCLKALMAAGLILEQARPRQRRPRTYEFDLDAWILLDPEYQETVSATQHVACLESPDPQPIAGLSRIEGETSDPFGLGSQKRWPDRQVRNPGSQIQSPDSQPITTDPVLMNSHSLNSHKNGRELSEKRTSDKAFDEAKAIAKKYLIDQNLPKSVAEVHVFEECETFGIHTDLAVRAVEHHHALRKMRARFRPGAQ